MGKKTSFKNKLHEKINLAFKTSKARLHTSVNKQLFENAFLIIKCTNQNSGMVKITVILFLLYISFINIFN